MRIGRHTITPNLILAPMAGVTDKPFRLLCKQLGAGLAVSEMTIADPKLWHTRKSRLRMDHSDEPAPIAVQIAGYDPQMLADAARYNVDHGAEIIDINMGCPAKKVCNVWSGSALLRWPCMAARAKICIKARLNTKPSVRSSRRSRSRSRPMATSTRLKKQNKCSNRPAATPC